MTSASSLICIRVLVHLNSLVPETLFYNLFSPHKTSEKAHPGPNGNYLLLGITGLGTSKSLAKMTLQSFQAGLMPSTEAA